MRSVILALAATLAFAASSQAQDLAPPKIQDRFESVIAPTVPPRFNFIRIGDAFLRLDNQSGQVAYCASNGTSWTCQEVPEQSVSLQKDMERLRNDISALQAELGRLKDEVDAQKKEIADLREPPPPVPPLPVPPPEGRHFTFAPTPEQLTRARTYLSQTWRRVVDTIASWQDQMMRGN